MRKLISHLGMKYTPIPIFYQKNTINKIDTLIGSSINGAEGTPIVIEHARNRIASRGLLRMNISFEFSNKK